STRELLNGAGATSRRDGSPAVHWDATWPWALLLVVPVMFHQLVLVKNDLFVGAIVLVASAWALTRADRASWREVAWASWLAGLAVAVKLTSLPVAVVLAGAVLWRRENR